MFRVETKGGEFLTACRFAEEATFTMRHHPRAGRVVREDGTLIATKLPPSEFVAWNNWHQPVNTVSLFWGAA